MNRSIANVVFGAFGQIKATGAPAAAGPDGGAVRSATADDVAVMLAYAQRVVIVPGYGMAVAQAQHEVRQLADLPGRDALLAQLAGTLNHGVAQLATALNSAVAQLANSLEAYRQKLEAAA